VASLAGLPRFGDGRLSGGWRGGGGRRRTTVYPWFNGGGGFFLGRVEQVTSNDDILPDRTVFSLSGFGEYDLAPLSGCMLCMLVCMTCFCVNTCAFNTSNALGRRQC